MPGPFDEVRSDRASDRRLGGQVVVRSDAQHDARVAGHTKEYANRVGIDEHVRAEVGVRREPGRCVVNVVVHPGQLAIVLGHTDQGYLSIDGCPNRHCGGNGAS
jgi:hypothetical protein